jgi:predicted ester cyclase
MNQSSSSPENNVQAGNIAIVTRLFEEVVNNDNIEIVDELLAPDIENHNPGPSDAPGRQGIREVFWLLHTAFPDLHGRIDDIMAEGDRVVVRWTIGGTNTRRCMGIGPTGRTISGTGIDILRIVDGRMTERWGNSDDMVMLHQMGLLEDVLSCPSFNPHVERLNLQSGQCPSSRED